MDWLADRQVPPKKNRARHFHTEMPGPIYSLVLLRNKHRQEYTASICFHW